jgi:hypothetical protein
VELYFHSCNTPSWCEAQLKSTEITLPLPLPLPSCLSVHPYAHVQCISLTNLGEISHKVSNNSIEFNSVEKLIVAQLVKKITVVYGT